MYARCSFGIVLAKEARVCMIAKGCLGLEIDRKNLNNMSSVEHMTELHILEVSHLSQTWHSRRHAHAACSEWKNVSAALG